MLRTHVFLSRFIRMAWKELDTLKGGKERQKHLIESHETRCIVFSSSGESLET